MFGDKLRRARSFNVRSASRELPESAMASPTRANLLCVRNDKKTRPDPRAQNMRKLFQKNKLEKRLSVSLDDVASESYARNLMGKTGNMYETQRSASDFDIQHADKRNVVYDDLIKELRVKQVKEYASLERINEEKGQTCINQIQPFPIEIPPLVELRHKPDAPKRNSLRSRTLHNFHHEHFDKQSDYIDDVQIDLKGVTKVLYDGNTKKIGKNQLVKIGGDQMFILDEKGEREVIIERLHDTGFKPISKKEITITTTIGDVCKVCKLQFDSTKDMNLVSLDLRQLYGSNRSLTKPHNYGEEKSQIRYRLWKLLGKRSSKDLLEEKGILQNEAIFGNTLKHLSEMYKQDVPEFVVRILQIIEMPKNIKSMGLYRASGNLATIQKIRFHIDKNNLKILDEFKNDIDVLTGSLKLFFRELKEPLISHKTYEELCRFIDTDINAKVDEQIKKTVNKMEKPHRLTLLTLLEHLSKVQLHTEENKMDAYNISIVWGPTLMWPPDNCHENILLNHTNANKIVEMLLHVHKRIFSEGSQRNEPSLKNSFKKAANDNLIHNKNTLMLQLNENLTNSLKHAGSRDSIGKSLENLLKFKDQSPKTPDKDTKMSLEFLCAANSNEKIPDFVLKVVTLIEKCINTEMLYKRSGSNEKLEKIQKKLSKNKSNLNSMEKYNVHDLAWTLKHFFANLKEPIIPKDVFKNLVLATDERIEVKKLKNAIKELSNNEARIPFKDTLDYLLRHLVKVSWHEQSNKMSKHNIATEWAPFLFRAYIERQEFSAGICVCVLETLLQIYDNKTTINVDCDGDSKPNLDVYNNIYRINDAETAAIIKRRPNIEKNESSLYRVSRVITNSLSIYDNLDAYTEHVKDEATILEENSAMRTKTTTTFGIRKIAEDRTKL